MLLKALDFANQFDTISSQEKEIIMHSRKSSLFDKNEPWAKKDNANLLRARSLRTSRPTSLNKLNEKWDNNKSIGLYQDDGLAAIRHGGPRSGDWIRKMFCEVFAGSGIKITAQANLHVNFPDITLNLKNSKYMPHRKPDDPPCYVNSQTTLQQSLNNYQQRLARGFHLYHATLRNSIRQSLFMTLLYDLVVLPVN